MVIPLSSPADGANIFSLAPNLRTFFVYFKSLLTRRPPPVFTEPKRCSIDKSSYCSEGPRRASLHKLLLVNNYDASHRERALTLKASLARRGGRVEVTDWNLLSAAKLREYDRVVLSGSYDMLSQAMTQTKFAKEIDAMKDSGGPVLGVC